MAVFSTPVTMPLPIELLPNAVLLTAVPYRYALFPTAVRSVPVALFASAFSPTAVLPVIAPAPLPTVRPEISASQPAVSVVPLKQRLALSVCRPPVVLYTTRFGVRLVFVIEDDETPVRPVNDVTHCGAVPLDVITVLAAPIERNVVALAPD